MSRARGQALIAALLLVTVLAAGALLANGDLRAHAEALAHARSLEALAQARSALIGYAISYEERHPGEGYGFLPCPDSGNDGSTPIGACGARGVAAIGRLPWRTLGLPDLRDGWGECLWYAVAGSAKHNPKPLTLNWDSPGQFELLTASADRLPVAAPDGRAIAVVFAPGRALDGQVRPPGRPFGCSGSDSAPADLAQYLDESYPPGATGPVQITQAALRPGEESAANDLTAWLGTDDVFDALRQRHDHAAYVDALIDRAAAALSARLNSGGEDWLAIHAARTGSLAIGMLPAAEALGIPAGERMQIDLWRDQMRFAACPDGDTCITVSRNDPPLVEHCRAALAFGGERQRSGPARQDRVTPAQRAELTQFFEGINATNLITGEPAFAGTARFATPDRDQPATADVIRCLP
ncbi:hypothetical protein [Thauera sp.]|jgi:hypothetical protein|uniref:hypothetical protein n=1 Tax=Thauera sp. TaxID=1905334 RepID=UPI002A35E7F0|nr:hypothetical protein [Thauera sp.]MDX9885864.1 hypothetical protein [Thauera sp.]